MFATYYKNISGKFPIWHVRCNTYTVGEGVIEVSLTESQYESVKGPTQAGLCIVMACTDQTEADEVTQQLSQLNNGCLITYRRAEDLVFNAPAGRVALVILATNDSPEVLRRTLSWLRNRWSSCPVTVVGNEGGGRHELAAREGGAIYLTRPVEPHEWSSILAHVLKERHQVVGK